MKKIIAVGIFLFALGLFLFFLINSQRNTSIKISYKDSQKEKSEALIKVVYKNLDTPWSIDFLPDGRIIFSERNGNIRVDGKIIGKIKNAVEIGEGGLLGLAVDPNYQENNYIYVYYTFRKGIEIKNRISKIKLDNKTLNLNEEKIIVDDIPGAFVHNGGRIKFGPDGNLYVTTGDASNPALSQDKSSLAGKILKIDKKDNLTIFSYGHRNSQGLAWNDKGMMYSTEHGRSGIKSGLDEINIIKQGKNYGWPVIQGDEKKHGMESPLIHSGEITWAPAGMVFFEGKFYFAGLRGQAIYQFSFDNKNTSRIKEYFKGKFGRIRDITIGPDRMIYFSTSNRDGRGQPKEDDDKIIKVNPKFFYN